MPDSAPAGDGPRDGPPGAIPASRRGAARESAKGPGVEDAPAPPREGPEPPVTGRPSERGATETVAAGRRRRALRLVGGNALLLLAGLLLVGLAGEAWLRLTTPFMLSRMPRRFVPEVGFLGVPHTEVRWTNGRDFWQVSRTNRWGFVDREPVEPEVGAAGCRVTVIGDSFVEGKEVALADRSHVVLEEMAAAELPELEVTASAFGRGGTGQINQLAIYDEYARRTRPKVLVLYFHLDDFTDNSAVLSALAHGLDPERLPYFSAVRDEGGTIRLRPPHPHFNDYRLAETSGLPESASRSLREVWERLRGKSHLLDWLWAEAGTAVRARSARRGSARAAALTPDRAFSGWIEKGEGYLPRSAAIAIAEAKSAGTPLPPVLRDAWEITGFALDEFRARAERDGASPVLLVVDRTRRLGGEALVDALRSLAEPRGIPVLDHYEAIVRRGFDPEQARWPHDGHWNENGHRWAAEALLDFLRRNPEACEGAGARPEPLLSGPGPDRRPDRGDAAFASAARR